MKNFAENAILRMWDQEILVVNIGLKYCKTGSGKQKWTNRIPSG